MHAEMLYQASSSYLTSYNGRQHSNNKEKTKTYQEVSRLVAYSSLTGLSWQFYEAEAVAMYLLEITAIVAQTS